MATPRKTPGRQQDVQATIRDIQERLSRLERREWWMWWTAVVVLLLASTAVSSTSFPALLGENISFQQFQIGQALRGLIGLVLLFNTYTIYQHLRIRRLKRQLAEAMQKTGELETRADGLYQLAVRDSLTGLYNRRYAEERVASEVARAERHGEVFSVVTLDLDNFKQLNDQYGHAAGDEVLRQFAAHLNRLVRATDMAARMGGDEFMLLLPECSPEQTANVLGRLSPLEVTVADRRLPLVISAGWTGFEPGDQPGQMLERADRSLYENKRGARASQQIPAAS